MKSLLGLFCMMVFNGIIINAQTKRALLVAIENYPASSGWPTLNTLNDVTLIKNALLKQNFPIANINVITDSQATKQGIEKALDQLISDSKTGDIIVIHFSSHGQQVEDDNIGEEVDGLDECIVPYGAIKSNDKSIFNEVSAGYFRDDLFGEKIRLLRNKLGRKGHVLVTIDACHSGSGTRGGGPKIRGSSEPIVSADFEKKKRELKDTAGVFKDNNNTALDSDAATYVVISGAQAQENNAETFDDEGNPVGSLSYAFSKTISTLDEKLTYRTLFARIEDILREKVPEQKPALEGDGIDKILFEGKYELQKPYVTGIVDKTNKKIILLNGGTITGINKGSVINFYPAGTVNPEGKTPLVKGVVDTTKYFTATVKLTKENPALVNKVLWAFVAEMAYGNKKIKLGIDSLSTSEALKIKSSLREFQLADLQPPYDLYFGKSDKPGNVWSLRYTGSGIIFADSISIENNEQIKRVLKRFDRYRYLRNLTFNMPDLSAKVMLVLVDENGNNDFVKTKERTKMGSLEIKSGDAVRPLMVNTGKKVFYVNIVDIQPDGIINPVIPNKKLKDLKNREAPITWQDCMVKPNDTLKVIARKNFAIRISPPYGEETFKIFISENPLDLEEILTTNGNSDVNSRGAGGQLNKLAKIFKESEVNETGARGGPTINKDKDGTIINLNFRIVPK